MALDTSMETVRQVNPQGVPGDGRPNDENGARKTKLIPILLLAGVVAVAAGVWYYLHSRTHVSTDNAQVDAHIIPISSKVAGNVIEVLVNDNQPVKRGQVLVRIDPRDYEARVNQAAAALKLAQSQARAADVGVPLAEATTSSGASGAEAQLATAEAELSRSRTGADQASTSEIQYAQANVESKRASAERARADLERMRPLAAKEEISRLQFDAYVAAERVASSDLRAAQERLEGARQQARNAGEAVAAARSRVAQARAQLAGSRANRQQVKVQAAQAASASAAAEQALANLQAAQLQLSYTTIIAPEDGVVTRKTVEVGQVVQAGQGFLVLIPLQNVWVTANFKETQLAEVRPGQRAEIKVDMYDRTFPAHVDSIAGASGARLSLLPPENATGNFVKVVQRIPVKIRLDPDGSRDAVLRPGMNVDATIYIR